MTTVDVSDPARALRTLREALAGASGSLGHAITTREVSLPLIAELDEALSNAPRLAAAIDQLLTAADPGRAVATDLQRWSAELVSARDRLAGVREQLNRTAGAEAEVREAAAEADREQARLDDLRRAERMAGRLDELRAARTALERQVGAQRDRVSAEERAFWEPLDAAIALIERLAGDLDAETLERGRRAAELAAEVTDKQGQLATSDTAAEHSRTQIELLNTEIAAAAERQRQLTAELEETVQRHRRHAEADRQLADAFSAGPPADGAVPNIDEARDRLTAVEEQLTAIDKVLRDALTATEQDSAARSAQIRPGSR
jgi:chromosome segregation ATPase